MPDKPVAYVLRTDTVIEPFNDPGWKGRVLDVPLVTIQRRLFKRFGYTTREIASIDEISGPGLLIADDLFITPQLLKRFLQATKKVTGSVGIGVEPCVFTMRTNHLRGTPTVEQDGEELLPYPLFKLDGPVADLNALPRVKVTLREWITEPKGIEFFRPEGADIRQSITPDIIMHLDHWTQILYANFLGIPAWWMDVGPGRILWMLWRVIRSLSLRPIQWFGKMNWIHPLASVHPTARLEGCIVRKGAKVGAFAYGVGSVLGEGCEVEPQSRVFMSVIGKGAKVAANSQCLMSVCYPDSLISIPGVQLCVAGDGALLLGTSSYLDLKFQREVKVIYRGELRTLGTNNMGVCVGHRSIIAARVLCDAGLGVPNDVVVVPQGDQILAKIPADAPKHTPLMVKDRTVVPLYDLKRKA